MPQAVEVALGTSGDTLTLMTTEAGGYTLNGEAFASGAEVMAEANGSTYTLTLDGTTWSAAYKAPAAMSVTLGTHGGSISVERLEDGSYQANGSALSSGTVVAGENNNSYTVTISDDGKFSTEYVVPPAVSIPLGSSGSSVDVTKNENGTYSANGEVITANTRITAENGNVYGPVMANGIPVGVMHIAAMQDAMLGELGGMLSLTQREDKSWVISGTTTVVTDGYVYAASNGNNYKLMMDAAGMWSGMYQMVEQAVDLGTQGPITLTRNENMSWQYGSEPVTVGTSVNSANGNEYTLWYTDGTWSARFEPVATMIEGTGLTALTREPDDMYDVNGSTLPANGMGDVTVDGAMYHVWMTEDGGLAGARFDNALHGDSDVPAFGIIGDLRKGSAYTTDADDDFGTDILPKLSANDEDTTANELRTMLQLGDHSFSMADLLDSGMAKDMGDNFVVKARGKIEKARSDVASLLGLASEPGNLSTLLGDAWDDVQAQVDTLFGTTGTGQDLTSNVDLGNTPGEDDILDEIDDVLAALSSGTQFAAATKEDGKGVFEDAKLSEANAMKAFDAAMSEATATFGMTGSTRYGVISSKERSIATSDLDYDMGANLGNGDTGEVGMIGAFSYSTIDDVQRVWDITQEGTAYYEGGTNAVSGNGNMYTGDIAIEVRFNTKRVSGLVTNLQSTDGSAWTYQYGEVESIILTPATNLDNNAHWSGSATTATASNAARITFSPRAGSPLPQPIVGSFQGQLLGRNAASGSEAHGTWSIGTQSTSGSASYLAGGFGATRVADDGPVRPGTDNGSVHETVVTSSDGGGDSQLDKQVQARRRELGGDDEPRQAGTWTPRPRKSKTLTTSRAMAPLPLFEISWAQ